LLAKLLHIPPILLGLSSITLLELGNGRNETDVDQIDSPVASTQTMTTYEQLLALSWELYYTSSVQKAEVSIQDALQQLQAGFQPATGVRKDQWDALRCRFYQLYSLIMRDRLDLDQAMHYENEAVEISFRLKNAELIASSLLRRARILLRQENYQNALDDALMALPYADLTRDPLKGKCYQMAGEAQGYLAGNNRVLQEKSLAYFNKAAQIARKSDGQADGSFVKTDLTSIFIEKADALILFGRFSEAHNALALARKNLSPELTRWEINLLLSEARMYVAQKDVESCCETLIDALNLTRALRLTSKKERVLALYRKCQQIAPNNATVQSLEKLLRAS
jgi:tetratricopeptide (TPR) repeat protein